MNTTATDSNSATTTTAAFAPSDIATPRMLDIARRSRRQLDEMFLRGQTPDDDLLIGWEFCGINAVPATRLIGIRKFIKGFERSGDGRVYGYNLPTVQNKLTETWMAKGKRFGFYQVAPVDPAARDNAYLHALLLDYGRGDNPRLDPSRGLRDYLVQIDLHNPDLFLGMAYYALGPVRVPLSHFVLQRMRPGDGQSTTLSRGSS